MTLSKSSENWAKILVKTLDVKMHFPLTSVEPSGHSHFGNTWILS